MILPVVSNTHPNVGNLGKLAVAAPDSEQHGSPALPVVTSDQVPASRRAGRLGLPVLSLSRLVLVVGLVVLVGTPLAGYSLVHSMHQPNKTVVITPRSPNLPQSTPPPAPPSATPSPVPRPTSPAAQPPPLPTPPSPPSLPSIVGKDTGYDLGVLVIKYFPLTHGGKNIDASVTGDVGDPYPLIRQRTIDSTNNLLTYIPKATQYLGYKYSGDAPSIRLHVVATFEHTTTVPINGTIHPGFPTYPDYAGIMNSHNICGYVDGQGVHEVFLWAYQGPNKPGTNYPYLGIEESKMSGPYGDISNSYEWNDMPKCQHTYVVYTFNYGRGTGEAIHSWSHQIEYELRAVDSRLFDLFQGPNYPQTLGVTGRCGSVHNPPNARQEYDWSNTVPQPSDCESWNPDGIGTTTKLSCAVWGCNYVSDSNNSQLNWIVWMWQNLPGRNNPKTYHGAQLRNWWDVHGEFDYAMGHSRKLTL